MVYRLFSWLFVFVLGWAVSAPAATIFPTNSNWRLFKGRSEASSPDAAAWRLLTFDDSAWTNGVAPFYVGESYPSGTLLSDMQNQYSTIFLRRAFTATNVGQIGWLALGARCDDGFIAWINGTEVYRYNVPAGVRAYNTFSASNVPEPIPFNFYQITNVASFLVNGTNLIAVQAFNTTLASGDLVIDVSLDWLPPDYTAPVITSVSPPPWATVSNLTRVTVTFSEPVRGVHASDLLVNGQTATNVTGANNSYTFTFPQPAYGTARFTWAAAHGITDQAAPANRFDETAAGATWQYELVDLDPPYIVMLNPPAHATVRHLRQVEVTFNEPVTNVDAGDLLLNNAPATNLIARSASSYVFQFAEPAPGAVQVHWAAGHGIRDRAPAGNAFGGITWVYTLDPYAPLADVRINEFLTGNAGTTGLKDEDGELQDWIELFNNGTNTVNLSGWSLTDDADAPEQWTFPPLLLGPKQYLVVFASGKDRRPSTTNSPLHTNFKLSPNGEYLGLYDAESPRHVMAKLAPQYPEQRNDYSYGLDAAGFWRYFQTPTPGASNGLSTIEGVVAAPHFSVGHGFFDAPFDLHLTTATPGATIRYTTNGTAPSLTQGYDYSGPLRLSRLTVLRAAAFKANLLPSTVETRTFLFLDSVITQPANPPGFPSSWITATADYEVDPNVVNHPAYSNSFKGDLMSVPTISLVMDNDHLFSSNGIYANPESSGLAWERPASVEMIYADGRAGFQANCGVRIQGGVGRRPVVLKHSLRFIFKGDYGPARLNHPIFAGNPVTEFDTFVLRAGFNNSYVWSAGDAARMHYLQDQWIRDAYRAMGQESEYGNFVHVYVNGLYWGLYNALERPSAPYCADHFGGDKSEWDAINSSEAIDGNKTAWNTMHAIANAGITNEAAYQAIRQYLNVTNLIDYLLVNFYGGNVDWDSHNWYAARRRVPGAGFMFFCWDAERSLESPTGNDRTGLNLADCPSRIYTQLRAYPEFRLLFADRAHRHLFNDGTLTPGPAKALFAALTNQIYRAMVGESARWGDKLREPPFLRDTDWLNGANCVNWEMGTFFPQRTAAFLTQLRNASLYPATVAPTFNPQHGGRVARGFTLTLYAPAGTIYYTLDGSDPRVYGTGAVSPSAHAWNGLPLVLNTSVTVKARVLDGGTWSALNEATYQIAELGSPLRFTEIMYNPPGGDTYEFIEIQNTGGTTVDMSRMRLEGVTHEFMPGTMLAPGARLVVAASLNPTAWAARYPGVTPAGHFTGRLADGGERLALLDADGCVLTAVTYEDEAGWPTAADGDGSSLEVLDPASDPNDPANWIASAVLNGTPGAAAALLPASPVVINEIMADNQGAVANYGEFPDWIELRNLGGSPTNLAGWSLSDDGNPRKFVFPPDTIVPANGYLLLWCDAAANPAPGSLHTGFGLKREGESVFLYDLSGTRVDAVTLGLQLPNYSVGRIDTAWQLNLPTPNAANQTAPLASASQVVVNEWLANPPPGGDDWIELLNRDPLHPAALRGLWLATTNALFEMRALSFVAPGGFAVLKADGNAGVDHVGFSMPKEGGSIALYDETATLVSQVAYGAQLSGVTRGRWPNGGAGLMDFPNGGSPGASNYLATYTGPVLNEVMARNVAAVTDSAGRTTDWVELFNPHPTNVNLGGLSLSLDEPKPGQWTFPADTFIPANGYLVVWCDNDRPASTNFEADLNCGRALDADSGGAYLFNAAGQLVSLVEHGFQIADQSIGQSGGAWRLLAMPTPGAANASPATLGAAAHLRVNEWMANPTDGDDWFELFNTDALPVDLGGLFLSDEPSLASQTRFQVAPLSFIAGRGFVKFVADAQPSRGRHHVSFALNELGEMLLIYSPATNLIDAVSFGVQAAGASQGRLMDGAANAVVFASSPTPGESNYLPLDTLVINEVLTHAHPPLENAVELFNPTSSHVTIGGWFLSDAQNQLKKYRIPNGTVVPARSYRVIYGRQFADGSTNSFTFNSARGGSVWLSQADLGGNLTGRRATASFGAALDGVSFGRHPTSAGVDFVALSQRTFGRDDPATVEEFRTGKGASNAPPRVSPVVISEIMYHPPEPWTGDGFVENHGEEFIELHNLTDAEVPLFDPANPTNRWRLAEAVEFEFPADAFLPPHGYLLVVGFDPSTNTAATDDFRLRHGVPASTELFGPFGGRLDNAGESVELYQPGQPEDSVVPYVLGDRVKYAPSAPWSISADGAGFSLQRINSFAYGNEPTNWLASAPTAGRVNGTATNIPPLIVREPADQTNYAGLSATFTVLADGTPPLSYQWRFNGADLAGAVGSSLTFTNLRPEQAGTYSVVVANDIGAVTSRVARLTVHEPLLEIIEQPQSQTVVAGGQAFFEVTVVGIGPFTFQWRQNGALIPEATNAFLLLGSVQAIQAGVYTVDVTSALTNRMSQPASLSVLLPPTFIEHPQSQTVTAYTAVSFSVAVSGTTPMFFQWRFNESSLPQGTNAVLTLNHVQKTQEGNYSVQVFNSAGSTVSAAARLTVLLPATITQPPTNLTVRAGSNVTFSVTAIGTGTLRYQWRFNGTNLPDATNAVLVIPNAQLSHIGNYDVIVADDLAPTVSQPAALVVLARPTITEQPQSQTVAVGETITLTAQAEGTAPITYRWRKNILLSYPVSVDAHLVLANAVLTNAGSYDVVITNAVGPAPSSARAYVIVVDPPTNQTIKLGSNTILRAVVSQPPTTFTNRYYWQFKGNTLDAGTNITTGGKGMFTNELVLTNVTAGQIGIYAFVLSNAFVTTNVVVVTNPVPATNTVLTTNFIGAPAAFLARLQVEDGDTDADGMPDPWEIEHGLDMYADDAALDADGDGTDNLAEYWAGTSPTDAASVLKFDYTRGEQGVILTFTATSAHAYVVQFKESLSDSPWQVFTNVPARTTNQLVRIPIPTAADSLRIFRLFLNR